MPDGTDSGASWYLIQSKPRQGERAEQHLTNQGYHCFHPQIRTEKLRKGRREHVTEPLFPGYLFILLQPGIDSWQPIRSTRGVARLVSFAGRPAEVTEDVVRQIQQRITSDTETEVPALRPGDTLRLTGGAFHDVDAIFECFDGEDRVIVLLSMMQQQCQVRVPISQIARTA